MTRATRLHSWLFCEYEGDMKIIRLEDAKDWPQVKSLTPEELKQAYSLARRAFTADDLQKFTELDEGVPLDLFIAELEKIQEEHDRGNAP